MRQARFGLDLVSIQYLFDTSVEEFDRHAPPTIALRAALYGLPFVVLHGDPS
jgi:hypothetical protein